MTSRRSVECGHECFPVLLIENKDSPVRAGLFGILGITSSHLFPLSNGIAHWTAAICKKALPLALHPHNAAMWIGPAHDWR